MKDLVSQLSHRERSLPLFLLPARWIAAVGFASTVKVRIKKCKGEDVRTVDPAFLTVNVWPSLRATRQKFADLDMGWHSTFLPEM